MLDQLLVEWYEFRKRMEGSAATSQRRASLKYQIGLPGMVGCFWISTTGRTYAQWFNMSMMQIIPGWDKLIRNPPPQNPNLR
jgi:hypothetical protein